MVENLVIAIHELFGDRSVSIVAMSTSPRFIRVFLRTGDGDYETPERVLALYKEADVIIRVRDETNVTEQGDVLSEANAVYKRAYKLM